MKNEPWTIVDPPDETGMASETHKAFRAFPDKFHRRLLDLAAEIAPWRPTTESYDPELDVLGSTLATIHDRDGDTTPLDWPAIAERLAEHIKYYAETKGPDSRQVTLATELAALAHAMASTDVTTPPGAPSATGSEPLSSRAGSTRFSPTRRGVDAAPGRSERPLVDKRTFEADFVEAKRHLSELVGVVVTDDLVSAVTTTWREAGPNPVHALDALDVFRAGVQRRHGLLDPRHRLVLAMRIGLGQHTVEAMQFAAIVERMRLDGIDESVEGIDEYDGE